MKKASHYSECVKGPLNCMKSFGGNFGTCSDVFYGGSKCDMYIPTWKRGSNIKFSIAIHYLRKIEPKSPKLCKSMFQTLKRDFERLLGSRDEAGTKTRLTQKLHWKAL